MARLMLLPRNVLAPGSDVGGRRADPSRKPTLPGHPLEPRFCDIAVGRNRDRPDWVWDRSFDLPRDSAIQSVYGPQ